MGLFCMTISKDPVEMVKCVMGNCNIWLDYATKAKSYKHDDTLKTVEEQQFDMLYLLETFASYELDNAIKTVRKGRYDFQHDEEHF